MISLLNFILVFNCNLNTPIVNIRLFSLFLHNFLPRRARTCRRQVYLDIPVSQMKAESDNYCPLSPSKKIRFGETKLVPYILYQFKGCIHMSYQQLIDDKVKPNGLEGRRRQHFYQICLYRVNILCFIELYEVMTFLEKDDLALSISMTMMTTILSLIVTPALMFFFAGEWLEILFYTMMISIFQVVVIPFF